MGYPQGTSEATKRKTKDNSQRSVKRRKIAMESLVDDCLLRIFSYLDLRDLEKVEQVSTRFQELARRSFCVYRSIDCDRDKIRTLSHARTISAKVGPGLRQLTGSGNKFTAGMLEAFLVNCPNIEHFEFGFLPVQDLGMLRLLDDFLAQGDIKIKSVSFYGCHLDDSQDTTFFRHLERATNLEEVRVKCNPDITGKWLKFFKNLKKIDLKTYSNLQPHHFIEFCKRNQTLVNLKVSTCAMNQECVKTIAEELKNLQRISINCEDFPDSANLSILANLPKLEKLEIFALNHSAVPLLQRLAFHNKLRALKCFFGYSSPEEEEEEICREMVKIQGLKSFKFIHLLAGCYLNSFEFDDKYLQISPMDKLEELEIQETAVTDQGLFDFIIRNPSLKTLDITNCPKITNKFAQMIIPRLQTDFRSLSIHARGTRISGQYQKILLNEN